MLCIFRLLCFIEFLSINLDMLNMLNIGIGLSGIAWRQESQEDGEPRHVAVSECMGG